MVSDFSVVTVRCFHDSWIFSGTFGRYFKSFRFFCGDWKVSLKCL